ncbi:MAG: SPOR domain-containing protein [Bradyrhizobium sp.]
MADRYQDRRFPADGDYDRGGGAHASANGESDPLAELARLIGQTEPFASRGRANLPLQPRTTEQDQYGQYDRHDPYELSPESDEAPAPGPPSWIQRAARQETPPDPQQDYPSAVHPLHRYAATTPAPEADYDHAQPFVDPDQEPDLSRYDDALYGGPDSGARLDQHDQHDPAYADDAYTHQDEYNDGADEQPKRRGGMVTVFAVLALGVFGVGAAFAYRSYMGTARTGEPPIIRADAGPTKIVPAPVDGGAKVPDRMMSGDGTEKIVPREEAPVDVNTRSAPRVVFPPPSQSGNQPPAAGTPSAAFPANSGNGTLSSSEPRKIRTFSVRGDQADAAAIPVTPTSPAAAKPAATARAAGAGVPRTPPSAANASAASANSPLSLAPQAAQPAAEPPTRLATTNPAQVAPSGGGGSGGYLVQVSSQRSEADAQASFRALQGKFPSVLGSHVPLIRRADLGEKGIYYRAMVGPFNSPDEASQLCGSLKSAGGQCVVQKN